MSSIAEVFPHDDPVPVFLRQAAYAMSRNVVL